MSAPDSARIERWYRVALLAFPRHYRRKRGAEMLGTLLDGASPDQTRPTFRESASIVLAGVRCRFRLRHGPGPLLAALGVTTAAAMLTAMAGGWLAWMLGTGPLPAPQEADAIAAGAVSQELQSQERFDFLFGDNGYDFGARGGIEYLFHPHPTAADSGRALLADARRNLVTTGWTMDEITLTSSSQEPDGSGSAHVEGRRGGLRIVLTDSYGQTQLLLTRADPEHLAALTGIGAVLGGLCGWLLTVRSSRRLSRGAPVMRALALACTIVALTLLFPVCGYAAIGFSRGYDYGAPWALLEWEPIRALTLAGLLLGLVVVALAELRFGRASAHSAPPFKDKFSAGGL